MASGALSILMWTQWRWRIWNSPFARSVLTLVSANVVGQSILLVAMPIITRLYHPSAFGIFAAFNAIFALLLVASSLRYEYAIPLVGSDRSGRIMMLLALLLNALMAVVIGGGVVFWREEAAELMRLPALAGWFWLLPFILLGAGSYKIVRLWAVRGHDFRAIAGTRVVQSATAVLVQIVGGVLGLGAFGLIAGQFFGYSAGTFRLARGGLLDKDRLLQPTTWVRMRWLARRYDRFPKFDVAAAIVNTTSVQAPNFVLAGMFGANVAGYYALADRVLALPASLLGQAIGQVLYAHSRKAIIDGRINRMLLRTLSGLSALMVIPTLIIFFFGEQLFTIVFGMAWGPSGAFAGWLTLGATAQLLYSTISFILLATEGQHLNLLIHTAILSGKVVALGYGYSLGNPLAAIIGYSVVNTIGYLVAAGVVISRARRYSVT